MRRILRKIAEGEADKLGDTSTLADPSIVEVCRCVCVCLCWFFLFVRLSIDIISTVYQDYLLFFQTRLQRQPTRTRFCVHIREIMMASWSKGLSWPAFLCVCAR